MAKPFANLIKKLNDEYLKNRKKIPAVKGLAEKFPCQLCDATGALMMKIQFCKVNTPSNVFLNSKQKEIVAHSLCPCPACKGTGLDGDAFMASLDGDAKVSEILEQHGVAA